MNIICSPIFPPGLMIDAAVSLTRKVRVPGETTNGEVDRLCCSRFPARVRSFRFDTTGLKNVRETYGCFQK